MIPLRPVLSGVSVLLTGVVVLLTAIGFTDRWNGLDWRTRIRIQVAIIVVQFGIVLFLFTRR